MNKNKGFTLIELLAVIVIMAIIALIATPQVMKIITESRKTAAARSAEQIIKGINTSLMQEITKNNGTISTVTSITAIIDASKWADNVAPTAISVFIQDNIRVTNGTMSVNGYNITVTNGTAKAA